MKKIVTFLLSTIVSLQLYIPLFKVYHKNGYDVRMIVRKSIDRKHSDPTLREDDINSIVKKYRVTLIEIDEWLKDAGLTFCVDGDTNSKSYLNYIESLVVNLIGPMEKKERKRFTIVSLLENTNYVWRYHNYINLVDYVIFPHKDYLQSYKDWHMKHHDEYQEVPEKDDDKIIVYKRYLKKKKLLKDYPIFDNILALEPSVKYETVEELEPILDKQIESPKNLFLGTPKYDFKFDIKNIRKKHDIPNVDKIAVIFHPEYRIKIGVEKYGEDFLQFYNDIHDWLRKLGYYVIVKDRLKDKRLKRELKGDLHVYNQYVFPNPSIELLHMADIAIFFSSSAIEEVFYTNTMIVDVVIDDVDRLGFLRSNKYCYIIDKKLPTQEQFNQSVLKMKEDKQKKVHNKYIKKTMNKYYPLNKRPYSENIYNELEKIFTNRLKNKKAKKIKKK